MTSKKVKSYLMHHVVFLKFTEFAIGINVSVVGIPSIKMGGYVIRTI